MLTRRDVLKGVLAAPLAAVLPGTLQAATAVSVPAAVPTPGSASLQSFVVQWCDFDRWVRPTGADRNRPLLQVLIDEPGSQLQIIDGQLLILPDRYLAYVTYEADEVALEKIRKLLQSRRPSPQDYVIIEPPPLVNPAWHVTDLYDMNKLHRRYFHPHEIEKQVDEFTGEVGYVWKIPQAMRDAVHRGDRHTFLKFPWAMLQAAAAGRNFRFDPQSIVDVGAVG